MTTATATGYLHEIRNHSDMDVPRVDRKRDSRWLRQTLLHVERSGCVIVESVLSQDFIARARDALFGAREKIRQEPFAQRIMELAGGLGIVRLAFKYEPMLLEFLELPDVLEIIDQTVSPTAILHQQNGLILPPARKAGVKKSFENQFHMDFPRLLNGYLASINMLFAIDEFTRDNGGTLVVPGSHQGAARPSDANLESRVVATECPAGSMLVFDSTLVHASGRNNSSKDRLAVNNQFTRSFLKPQIDWVRALGDEVILAQKPRTQQLLGWYTRVPCSLDEFYRPDAERLYRKNQG